MDSYSYGRAQTELKVWQQVKEFPVMLEFMKAATRISFAMVLHKPPIEYRLAQDKYLGDNVQELYWNSVSPVTEKYHLHDVFPAMCKCENVLVKGKVFLGQFSDE